MTATLISHCSLCGHSPQQGGECTAGPKASCNSFDPLQTTRGSVDAVTGQWDESADRWAPAVGDDHTRAVRRHYSPVEQALALSARVMRRATPQADLPGSPPAGPCGRFPSDAVPPRRVAGAGQFDSHRDVEQLDHSHKG